MLKLSSRELPPQLKALAQPPKQLYIHGENFLEILKKPCLAIVGSRKVTPYGKAVTQMLASSLAAKGVVIISGLALGVDSVAHKAAVEAGGQTIAVLPCGPDQIYPSAHTQLAREILSNNGALVTEYETGRRPREFNFLERNRLIAALAEAVIIPEAAVRSGSLNTAGHALDLNKPVMAVPGNINSPLSAGCNNLIKAGAVPVTNVDDILSALKWQDLEEAAIEVMANNAEEQAILDLIKQGIADGSELLSASKLRPEIFNQTITMLEITGRVHALGANNWSL
jgi:DNA processing protein